VLDIDETLVHCGHELIEHPDLFFQVSLEGKAYPIYCLLRPHIHEFLATVSTVFNVVAFTASVQDYADHLLDLIDPEHIFFQQRFFRDSCGNNYAKNLLAVQEDLSTIAIVDNLPQAYGLQPANGIDVLSWYGDTSDDALLQLIPFLLSLSFFPDVRVPIRQRAIKKFQEKCIAAASSSPSLALNSSFSNSSCSNFPFPSCSSCSSSSLVSPVHHHVVDTNAPLISSAKIIGEEDGGDIDLDCGAEGNGECAGDENIVMMDTHSDDGDIE
jgi:CTD small phosphatase-like protein 2